MNKVEKRMERERESMIQLFFMCTYNFIIIDYRGINCFDTSKKGKKRLVDQKIIHKMFVEISLGHSKIQIFELKGIQPYKKLSSF